MSGMYRPRRRSLRSELAPLAGVLSLPLAIFVVFPREAVVFTPVAAQPVRGACSWVTLSPEEESKALVLARSAWQVDPTSVRRLRARLLTSNLPHEAQLPVLRLPDRLRTAEIRDVDYEPSVLPPTLASPAARVIPLDSPVAPTLAFPREELLRLDGPR